MANNSLEFAVRWTNSLFIWSFLKSLYSIRWLVVWSPATYRMCRHYNRHCWQPYRFSGRKAMWSVPSRPRRRYSVHHQLTQGHTDYYSWLFRRLPSRFCLYPPLPPGTATCDRPRPRSHCLLFGGRSGASGEIFPEFL